MPHADHFLSRLDRVSPPEVELALSLYNDVPLLRFVLESVKLPERAERVAISLGDRTAGPFLVVTRDGRFVTCLGKGMHPGELPVIGRSHLDALAARVGDLRERMDLATALSGGSESGYRRLLARIMKAGDELSREEFTAISAWVPMLRVEWAKQLLDTITYLADARDAVTAIGPNCTQPERDLLRTYWDNYWALCHLALLVGMAGTDLQDDFGDEHFPGLCKSAMWGTIRQGTNAALYRGAWMAARMGKAALPLAKEFLRAEPSLAKLMCGSASLIALSIRNRKLSAEIHKVLSATPRCTIESGPGHDYELALRTSLRATALHVLDESQWPGFEQTVLAIGKEDCFRISEGVQNESLRFSSAEGLPDDVARAYAFNLLGSYFANIEESVWMLAALPVAVRAQPEDFYFRKADLPRVKVHFTPELGRALVAGMKDHYAYKARPVRATKAPGRNDPCHCGSGKKYKRCCGA